jgi:hypothetical protein
MTPRPRESVQQYNPYEAPNKPMTSIDKVSLALSPSAILDLTCCRKEGYFLFLIVVVQ